MYLCICIYTRIQGIPRTYRVGKPYHIEYIHTIYIDRYRIYYIGKMSSSSFINAFGSTTRECWTVRTWWWILRGLRNIVFGPVPRAKSSWKRIFRWGGPQQRGFKTAKTHERKGRSWNGNCFSIPGPIRPIRIHRFLRSFVNLPEVFDFVVLFYFYFYFYFFTFGFTVFDSTT